MTLPARVNELPEGLRQSFALLDMATIGSQANQQVALHEQALEAAQGVMQAVAECIPGLPATNELQILLDQYSPDSMSGSDPKTMGGVARSLVSPDEPRETGVSDAAVVRHAIAALHPDRKTGDGSDDELDTAIRDLTEAMGTEDHTRVQGIYAATMANKASTANQPIGTLERDRYNAWVALTASKGKFTSAEEVEAWEKEQIAKVPYKLRAGMLSRVLGLYVFTLEPDEAGRISLSEAAYAPVSGGVDAAKAKIGWIYNDKTASSELSAIDLDQYDRGFNGLVKQLGELLDNYPPGVRASVGLKQYALIRFGRELAAVAGLLEGRKKKPLDDIGRIALNGLLRAIRPREQGPNKIKFHEEDLYGFEKNTKN